MAYSRHHQHPVQPQGCDKTIICLPQLYVGSMDVELDHLLRVFKAYVVETLERLKMHGIGSLI